jgi:hypothetical protein
LCTTFDDIGETLIVAPSSTTVVAYEELIKAFIQQPEQLALRSLKLAVPYCPIRTASGLYVQLAYKAPRLHTLELGCKRAPVSARSVCIAIKYMKNLRNL